MADAQIRDGKAEDDGHDDVEFAGITSISEQEAERTVLESLSRSLADDIAKKRSRLADVSAQLKDLLPVLRKEREDARVEGEIVPLTARQRLRARYLVMKADELRRERTKLQGDIRQSSLALGQVRPKNEALKETQAEFLVRTGQATPFSMKRREEPRSLTTSETVIRTSQVDSNLPESDQDEKASSEDVSSAEEIASGSEGRTGGRRTPDDPFVSFSESISESEIDDEKGKSVRDAGEFFEVVDDGGVLEGLSLATDDGDWTIFRKRMAAMKKMNRETVVFYEREREWLRCKTRDPKNPPEPLPETKDAHLDGGLIIPGEIHESLFPFQRTGVRWLWELHCQSVGGILGDEMGLGKTITTISFLASLDRSQKFKPTLVIVPATTLKQWTSEFHRWWPRFRVSILHDCGSHSLSPATNIAKEAFIRDIGRNGSVLLTTYSHVRLYAETFLSVSWGYVILDEGHMIRNPDAEITLVCKQFSTPHRLIISGAPIQNRLSELWSLFDFIVPGKLGTLPLFRAHFEIPIAVGGYANASMRAIRSAHSCAIVLRDTIAPYLLRRLKRDVKIDLPPMRERVVFCKLTPLQRRIYRTYLASSEVKEVVMGNLDRLWGRRGQGARGRLFRAIQTLRKICNHADLCPDILSYVDEMGGRAGEGDKNEEDREEEDVGERSGKLPVLERMLREWLVEGHRCLLFGQTRKLLDLLEAFCVSVGFRFLRLDGQTPIGQRSQLIRKFNTDDDVFLFLLTTRVGGLGINLTAADRVVVFDPDWNPVTDMQARERSWRIGQNREVRVYRLITSGTIEEKIYQRQIFKQMLTNRVLKDPSQRRVFKLGDLRDLFILRPETGGDGEGTQTGALFGDCASESTRTQTESVQGSEVSLVNQLLRSNNVASVFQHGELVGEEDYEQGSGAASTDTSRVSPRGVGARNRSHLSSITDLAELEAVRIAGHAAAQLRASHKRRRREGDDVSVPTWTGLSGLAGAPPPVRAKLMGGERDERKKRIPGFIPSTASPMRQTVPILGESNESARARVSLSSQDILARMELRKDADIGRASDDDETETAELPRDEAIRELRNFLWGKPGQRCSSAEVVAAFRSRIPMDDANVFRRMLREIASFSRDANSVGWWTLLGEYT